VAHLGDADDVLITVPEVRVLLWQIHWHQLPPVELVLNWNRWRRHASPSHGAAIINAAPGRNELNTIVLLSPGAIS
jgi:hypothetical protein